VLVASIIYPIHKSKWANTLVVLLKKKDPKIPRVV
jgi:hypothetical protein